MARMSSTSTTTRSDDRSAEEGGDWKRVSAVSLLGWVVICAVILAWGWLLTHPLESTIDPADDDVARWFADQRDPGLTDVAEAGTFLGETIVGVSVFLAIGLVVSLVKRTWRPIILVAILEAGIEAFYLASTELITRDRPPVKLLDSGLDPNASYPSGHVATSLICWAGAVVLIWVYFRSARWIALALLLLPLGTLLSRLYLGAHHLTDALTSVAYGSAWLLVVAGVLLPRRTP